MKRRKIVPNAPATLTAADAGTTTTDPSAPATGDGAGTAAKGNLKAKTTTAASKKRKAAKQKVVSDDSDNDMEDEPMGTAVDKTVIAGKTIRKLHGKGQGWQRPERRR